MNSPGVFCRRHLCPTGHRGTEPWREPRLPMAGPVGRYLNEVEVFARPPGGTQGPDHRPGQRTPAKPGRCRGVAESRSGGGTVAGRGAARPMLVRRAGRSIAEQRGAGGTPARSFPRDRSGNGPVAEKPRRASFSCGAADVHSAGETAFAEHRSVQLHCPRPRSHRQRAESAAGRLAGRAAFSGSPAARRRSSIPRTMARRRSFHPLSRPGFFPSSRGKIKLFCGGFHPIPTGRRRIVSRRRIIPKRGGGYPSTGRRRGPGPSIHERGPVPSHPRRDAVRSFRWPSPAAAPVHPIQAGRRRRIADGHRIILERGGGHPFPGRRPVAGVLLPAARPAAFLRRRPAGRSPAVATTAALRLSLTRSLSLSCHTVKLYRSQVHAWRDDR